MGQLMKKNDGLGQGVLVNGSKYKNFQNVFKFNKGSQNLIGVNKSLIIMCVFLPLHEPLPIIASLSFPDLLLFAILCTSFVPKKKRVPLVCTEN